VAAEAHFEQPEIEIFSACFLMFFCDLCGQELKAFNRQDRRGKQRSQRKAKDNGS
jgi:hypothetical protein